MNQSKQKHTQSRKAETTYKSCLERPGVTTTSCTIHICKWNAIYNIQRKKINKSYHTRLHKNVLWGCSEIERERDKVERHKNELSWWESWGCPQQQLAVNRDKRQIGRDSKWAQLIDEIDNCSASLVQKCAYKIRINNLVSQLGVKTRFADKATTVSSI